MQSLSRQLQNRLQKSLTDRITRRVRAISAVHPPRPLLLNSSLARQPPPQSRKPYSRRNRKKQRFGLQESLHVPVLTHRALRFLNSSPKQQKKENSIGSLKRGGERRIRTINIETEPAEQLREINALSFGDNFLQTEKFIISGNTIREIKGRHREELEEAAAKNKERATDLHRSQIRELQLKNLNVQQKNRVLLYVIKQYQAKNTVQIANFAKKISCFDINWEEKARLMVQSKQDEVRERLTQLKGEIEGLERRGEQLQQQLRVKSEVIQIAKNTFGNIEVSEGQLPTQSELKQRNNINLSYISELIQQKNRLFSRSLELEQQLEQQLLQNQLLNSSLAQLQSLNQQLQVRINQLTLKEKQLQQLQKERPLLINSIKRLQTSIQEMQHSILALEEEASSLSHKNQQLKDVNELYQTLASAHQQLQQQQVSQRTKYQQLMREVNKKVSQEPRQFHQLQNNCERIKSIRKNLQVGSEVAFAGLSNVSKLPKEETVRLFTQKINFLKYQYEEKDRILESQNIGLKCHIMQLRRDIQKAAQFDASLLSKIQTLRQRSLAATRSLQELMALGEKGRSQGERRGGCEKCEQGWMRLRRLGEQVCQRVEQRMRQEEQYRRSSD